MQISHIEVRRHPIWRREVLHEHRVASVGSRRVSRDLAFGAVIFAVAITFGALVARGMWGALR